MRSGIVAVVGRPNVGKSSLVNALVGRKVSIVTPKPQTTRFRVHGVAHLEEGQIVLVDTPGLQRRANRALNRAMNDTVHAALAGVDLILFVVDVTRWTDEDDAVCERLRGSSTPVGLALNKVDKVPDKGLLLPEIERLRGRGDFAFLVPLSARTLDNIEPLRRELLQYLPEGPPLYPPDQISGLTPAAMVGEIVREKLIRALAQELPYALTVEVVSLEREGALTRAGAVIWVEREGQKKIVIGEGGIMLKRVGSAARRELEVLLGGRLFLELWVRVHENWTEDPQALRRFGYTER